MLMMQLFEVLELSASNLPNVRRRSSSKTRAFVILEGPLTEPYRTEEDITGGLNPTWETPFTVSLYHKVELKLTVLIKRRALRNKAIATAVVSLKDFASPGGGSHEYSLLLCCKGRDSVQPAVLRMSARFLRGGVRQQPHHSEQQTPPAAAKNIPLPPPATATATAEYSTSSDVIADDSDDDSD